MVEIRMMVEETDTGVAVIMMTAPMGMKDLIEAAHNGNPEAGVAYKLLTALKAAAEKIDPSGTRDLDGKLHSDH